MQELRIPRWTCGGRLLPRQGRLAAAQAPEPVFLPLQVSDAMPPGPVAPTAATDPRIEIALPDGTLVWVGADVDAATLRRVLSVLPR